MTGTSEKQMMCIDCGYLLVKLPTQRCPKCGRWFDPSDDSTFRTAKKQSIWRKRPSPPPKIQNLIFAAISLYTIAFASGPLPWSDSGIWILGPILPALWFGLIFDYIVRLGAYWLERIRDRNRDAQRGSRRAWFVVPVCALLVISIFVYPWPLVVRFKLSEAAFNKAVEDYQAGTFSSDQWVGLYYVVDTTQVPSSSSRPPEIGFLTGSSSHVGTGFFYVSDLGYPMGYRPTKVATHWYAYGY